MPYDSKAWSPENFFSPAFTIKNTYIKVVVRKKSSETFPVHFLDMVDNYVQKTVDSHNQYHTDNPVTLKYITGYIKDNDAVAIYYTGDKTVYVAVLLSFLGFLSFIAGVSYGMAKVYKWVASGKPPEVIRSTGLSPFYIILLVGGAIVVFYLYGKYYR